MKRPAMCLLVLILSFCLAVGATAQAPPASQAPGAQKARVLLDKMIAALGGEAYLTYTSRSEQGRAYSFYEGTPSGPGVEFWYFWQSPDKDRTEVGKKRDVVQVHNGDKGYEITYKGTVPLGDKEMRDFLRTRAHSMQVVLRQWLKDPHTLVFYAGPGVADNRLVEQITLINARDESVTISVDPSSYLPIRKSFTYRDPIDNLKSEESEVYGNYRVEQGMMSAHSIVRSKNGEMISQRFLNRIAYNLPLSASLFDVNATYDPSPQQAKSGLAGDPDQAARKGSH